MRSVSGGVTSSCSLTSPTSRAVPPAFGVRQSSAAFHSPARRCQSGRGLPHSKSWRPIRTPRLELREDFFGVLFGFDLWPDLFDATVWTDEKRNSVGPHVLASHE